MEKISHEKVAALLTEASAALRAVTAERDTLATKLAQIERRSEAEKVAHAMQDKGLSSEPFDALVETLEKKAERGELGEIKTAVSMVGPDMGRKLASLTNDDKAYGAGSDLESYIAGSIA